MMKKVPSIRIDTHDTTLKQITTDGTNEEKNWTKKKTPHRNRRTELKKKEFASICSQF